MPIQAVETNDAMSDGSLPAVDTSAAVPAWLIAHRERQSKGLAPAHSPSPEPTASAAKAIPKPKPAVPALVATDANGGEEPDRQHWFVRWMSSQGMIGIMVSLVVHTVILSVLALILVSNVNSRETINLWGILGESEEVGSDLVLDTVIAGDAGESAPLQMADMSQTMEALGPGTDIPEPIRVGFGGKGTGEGESGDGISLGAPTLKIPGHAQTKGNFSVWTDPRDPNPNENYSIVIQMRLPASVKKFRAADLTGVVNGTDSYVQKIRFKSSEQFPVEDGVVELRIPVPGAAKRVRDTIKIESRLLREKQTFEIEF